MAYKDRFKLADDMIAHLDTVIDGISDPFIASRYIGFVAVAAVTVYELAIKDIFIEFGEKKHKVLGSLTRSYFGRINARIRKDDLLGNTGRFGEKYKKRFTRRLEEAEKRNLRSSGVSIESSYNNIIIWRHKFAHEGEIPSTVTYHEITKSYEAGKEVIRCLAETMRR